ncbi:MAG: hypothetical protein M9916_13000 [Crocinitomicaceae bacterium]|nr:hypothetical protein [Crocinitomicaceae bacterium]
MKKLIIYGGLFMLMSVFYACKKEIIQPTHIITTEDNTEYSSRGCVKPGQPTKPDSLDNGDNTDNGEGITDPNDDDYSRKRTSKVKV